MLPNYIIAGEQNPDLRKKLIKNGYEFAKKDFGLEPPADFIFKIIIKRKLL